MAGTKPGDLRDMEVSELEIRLTEAKQELFNLRFKHVTGQLPSSAQLGVLRKDVARIHTVLREKEIEAAEAAASEEGTRG